MLYPLTCAIRLQRNLCLRFKQSGLNLERRSSRVGSMKEHENFKRRKATAMNPDEIKLQELTQRIVAAVHPLRIILFGSASRGEMGANSDLDVLVVMPEGTHRRKTVEFLHFSLYGFGFAKDIFVATPSDIEKHGANPFMIIKSALDEGRELYAIGHNHPWNSGGVA